MWGLGFVFKVVYSVTISPLENPSVVYLQSDPKYKHKIRLDLTHKQRVTTSIHNNAQRQQDGYL